MSETTIAETDPAATTSDITDTEIASTPALEESGGSNTSDTATAAATGDPADTTDTDTDAGEASPAAAREAAKWRRKFRDAEATIEQMSSRLAVVQRGEAERLAAQHLADGADIWRDGATLDAILDDAGDIDPAKVIELAKATVAAHPHWKTRPLPPVIKRGGLHSGASAPADRTTPSWQSAIRNARR